MTGNDARHAQSGNRTVATKKYSANRQVQCLGLFRNRTDPGASQPRTPVLRADQSMECRFRNANGFDYGNISSRPEPAVVRSVPCPLAVVAPAQPWPVRQRPGARERVVLSRRAARGQLASATWSRRVAADGRRPFSKPDRVKTSLDFSPAPGAQDRRHATPPRPTDPCPPSLVVSHVSGAATASERLISGLFASHARPEKSCN